MVTAVGPVQDEMSAQQTRELLHTALKCIEFMSQQMSALSEGVEYESHRTSEIQKKLGAREESYTKQHELQKWRCTNVDAVAKRVGSKAAETAETVKTIHQAQMASPAGTAELDEACRQVFEPTPTPQTDAVPHQ